MKIQTLSILVGSKACNARCPFCVSKMTHSGNMDNKPPKINWRNLHVAIKLAKASGVTTVMLTGKGEPTLWIDTIDAYLKKLEDQFPLMEIQTNGIALHDVTDETLQRWYRRGITTIAISVSHWEDEKNKEIYLPHKDKYPPLENLIKRLHDIGFSVRLNCVMTKNLIGALGDVLKFVEFAKLNDVEQVTLTPVNYPRSAAKNMHSFWVNQHRLTQENITEIVNYFDECGTVLMRLAHGALVYDYYGQNVCLSNCLKVEEIDDKTVMRNLIFFPDGHLRYDWEHPGAILI